MQVTRKQFQKSIVAGGLAVVLLLCAAGLVYLFIANVLVQRVAQSPVNVEQKAPQPTALSSNILVFGNTFWGRYINDWSMASPLQQAYPFSRLHEFHRDEYNAWLTGLECPTVPGVTMTSAEMDATLTFNCDPSYLSEAAKWFTAFTLANNHTDNQGAEGFATTQQELAKHSIQYFGHYDPRALDDVCEVISLPITVTFDDATTSEGDLPVAMCGYHGVFRIPGEEAVNKMTEYAKYMPVLAFPHMGAEYKAEPDEIKTSLYRNMIDAGADVVLGDHPHWIQATESYKGRLIVYSMGNFMFDQQGASELRRSAAVRVVLSAEAADAGDLRDWLEIGKSCKEYHDSCLERIAQQSLKKLDISYRFGIVGTDSSGKIVKPANEAQQASILERLRWDQAVKQLQAPYQGL